MAHVRIKAMKDDATHVQEGWLYAPPATETLQHDDDGNLTSDARWTYTWDAENRLVAMEERDSVTRPTGAPPRRRVTFAYDYRHRRVAKEVREWSAGDGAFSRLVKSRRYVYDGWNMIAELDTADSPSTSLQRARVVSTYVWGPDLAGQQGSVFAPESLTSAGGVGGLLAVNHQGTTYYPCMDANGNIMGLVDATTGTVTARYDYDPFGARITDTGPTGSNGERIELCPFGFSTKYTDSETGLLYYGYRYYSPELGRWLNRDPIHERGGINLYGMVGNDAVNRRDYLGLSPIDPGPCGNCGVTIYVGHNTHVVEILRNRQKELTKTPNSCMSYGSVSCTTCLINSMWEKNMPDNSVDGLGEALRNYQANDPAKTVSAPEDPSKARDQDGGFLGAMRTARQKAIEEAKQLCGKGQCKCEKVTISIELIDVSDPAKDDNGFVKNLKNPAWDSYFSPTEYDCKTGAVKTTLVRR